MRTRITTVCFLAVMALVFGPAVRSAEPPTGTPSALVDTYESLAEAILAAKQTEWNLVHSILASAYQHAEGTVKQAMAKIEAGKDARAEIEQLATLVSQLANEGDASVAAVRKRLVEGGHHHNTQGEGQGLYDEGFVIVTREARKVFLDAASKIGKLSRSPDRASLEAEWQRVAGQFRKLHEGAGG